MMPNLERIDWMPSPPLVPDDTPVDRTHLSRMTLGDAALEREVLVLFERQSDKLLARLADMPADAAALAHTLKGSARAIGAFAVADAADALECAVHGHRPHGEPLRLLKRALEQARDAIGVLLRTS